MTGIVDPDDPIAPILAKMAERDARMETIAASLQDRLEGARLLTSADAAKLTSSLARTAAQGARDGVDGMTRAYAVRTGAVMASMLTATALACLAGGYAIGARRALDQCHGDAVRVADGQRYCVFWLDR